MKTTNQDYSVNRIIIMGDRSLQNDFLSYVLERELGVLCTICTSIEECNDCAQNQDELMGAFLVLIDSVEHSFEHIVKEILFHKQVLSESCLIALYNMSPTSGTEHKALRMRVKGFFYKNDRFDRFISGIKAIFDGEIWIDKEVLLRTVLDGFAEKRIEIKKRTELTHREVEILTLVSMGATNDEIAEKVQISPNTVKTHVYNIFKKIQVKNRMQAALWATKHL